MQTLKIEFKNELDLKLLDNEFFVAMLSEILGEVSKELIDRLPKAY